MKVENSKLKESLQVAEATVSCLQDEVESLKGKDSNIQKLNVELYKSTVDNLNKLELESSKQKISDLEKKLSEMLISSYKNEEYVSLKGEFDKLKDEKEMVRKWVEI